jgi:hypothetical protein
MVASLSLARNNHLQPKRSWHMMQTVALVIPLIPHAHIRNALYFGLFLVWI